ncbi:hypothetical protein [Marinobacter sp. Arc7-DN-1]|uniref:hypothetical protein n=1 Tax=Marinobacter sp. Arc7-DN-1 TaxID=2304594 RepID=UPI0039B6F02A
MSWLTRSKKLRQVDVHHDVVALLGIAVCSQNRILSPTARAEAVAVLAEGWIDQRLQHLQQCLLNQTVWSRWDTQFPFTSVRFRDAYPTDRLRR